MVDGDLVFGHQPADFVADAIRFAAREAAAGHPGTVRRRMVATAFGGRIRHERIAAEFGGPDDHGIVQHAA